MTLIGLLRVLKPALSGPGTKRIHYYYGLLKTLKMELESNVPEPVTLTSGKQISIKNFIFNSVSIIPRKSNIQQDPENPKRRSDPSSTSSNSGDGIEETFYIQNSEKRSLIIGSDPPENPNFNKVQKGKNGIFASTDTLFSDKQCRICHSGRDHPRNPLISPCKCSGTMKYVHIACLIRWLEVSSQKFWPTTECELCGYKFKRHPIWRVSFILISILSMFLYQFSDYELSSLLVIVIEVDYKYHIKSNSL